MPVTILKHSQNAESLPELTLQQLNKWLTSPPENSRRVRITPHVAAWILAELNKNNRPRKPEEIRRYSADMKADRWALTGDSIKFGTDGLLKDGQNRLSACVQAGIPIETHVVFGIDPAVFTILDRGKNRNPADVFHIAGITYPSDTSATVRWLLLIADDEVKARTTFQPDHLLREYQKISNPEELERCVKVGRQIKRLTRQPAAPVAAIYYFCRKKDPAKADEFFKAWANGAPNPVVVKVQKKLMKMASANNGRVHDVVRAALIVQAWNYFVKGQKGAMTKFDWSLTKPFPAIQG